MTIKANGTDAKDIALHFVSMVDIKPTPSIMSRTIKQVKTLLEHEYSKQSIIDVINFIVDVKKVKMYSFGYVSISIDDVLKEIKEQQSVEFNKTKSKEMQEKLTSIQIQQRHEVMNDEESTQRNKNKLNRFGAQSRFGEKFDFDMFERK